jgi:hypothetical protein
VRHDGSLPRAHHTARGERMHQGMTATQSERLYSAQSERGVACQAVPNPL